MKRAAFALAVSVASALGVAAERDAAACGGCFQPPVQTASDINDERMLLAVSTQQTTLYDQIQYTGNPTSFAWVLPIHGTVDVGLSADVLFDSLDVLTATQITQPPLDCPPPPSDCDDNGGASSGTTSLGGASLDGGSAEAPIVTVTKSENVGPYATVQLQTTDPNALNTWLAQNGFAIPAGVQTVLDQYVAEGFDFLAMKLLPGEGIQSMRPVRITSPGASLSLPLRMAAIGTGATVGITVWVVADGRYEPQNFPFFHIDDSALVWDWSTDLSNYTTLRVQNEANLGGKGWEIESSLTLNETLITNVILSGGQYFPNGGFGGPGYVEDAGEDYLATTEDAGPAEDGAVDDGGSSGETADQVRTDDIAALFAGMTGPNVRVTRIRSDISHAAMTSDFILQASSDQSELSNVRTVSTQVNQQCPIYDNCTIVGSGPPASAAPSSGTSSVGASTAAGGGTTVGGCIASPQRRLRGTLDPRFGAFGALVGLVVIRVLRKRRLSRRS